MCCGSGPSKTTASYGSFVNNRPILVGRLPTSTTSTSTMTSTTSSQFTNTGFLKVIKK